MEGVVLCSRVVGRGRRGVQAGVVNGCAPLVVKHGEMIEDAMKTQRLATADLLIAAREQGARRFCDIEYAVLEADGTLSFFPYEGDAGAPEKPASG
ncbi:uncharacterized membrane protein YcaP (DUF421 family) [Nocardioides sp. BE266]|uniref:YetF domain-containing protein n=1 Tax=Nocardioides sp. BE266 TaxID=2817725 RepID=UPI002863DD53|nr:YetF domain-containing protein [Nocardioides sp. BE266]MDR7255162.1 uncharacterized membrane protein YcaP (DUF421 family) [Nocardioides sp. BE266]